MNVFAEKLKQIRKETGKTQPEVAETINCPYQTIQRYETGKRLPNFEMLIKIADYFEVSIDWLCGRTEKREINK